MAKAKPKAQKETAPRSNRKPASKGGSLAEQVYEQLKEKNHHPAFSAGPVSQ